MTIQRFEIFNKVVQLQNITRAGMALNLTQSAVSHAIKSLEDELGLNLLVRSRTGMKPTREGEKIYHHTLNIMNNHEKLLQEASALKGVETGVINVGSISSITTNWLPSLLKQFNTEHPNITINIYEDDYECLEKGVESGELDCCFTIASEEKNIQFVPLKKDKLFCIVSNNNPLSKQRHMKVGQIKDYPLIKPKAGFDKEVNDFFHRHDINVSAKYEISDDLSIIALVEADLGINIRPELVLTNTNADITALEFEKEAHRIIGLGFLDQASHAAQKFIDAVIESYQTINRS